MKAETRGRQHAALFAAQKHNGTGRKAVVHDERRQFAGADHVGHFLRLADAAPDRFQPHHPDIGHRAQETFEFPCRAEGDAAGKFQHLAIRKHAELVRADPRVATDHFVHARDLRCGDE